ncbi:hypothetical protein KY289_009925 [Solanum tuberosum]|nr:hypothetical protein KY289_009925 [Solanum tuberosum]
MAASGKSILSSPDVVAGGCYSGVGTPLTDYTASLIISFGFFHFTARTISKTWKLYVYYAHRLSSPLYYISTSDSSDEPNTLSIKKVLHADSMVVPPKDVIDTMALYVLDGGCAFERAIMDPLFNFFFELGSKKSTYYIWRLYSLPQLIVLVT